jgi:hypothetical protein
LILITILDLQKKRNKISNKTMRKKHAKHLAETLLPKSVVDVEFCCGDIMNENTLPKRRRSNGTREKILKSIDISNKSKRKSNEKINNGNQSLQKAND